MIFEGKLGFWTHVGALGLLVGHWLWDNKWFFLAGFSASALCFWLGRR